MKRQHYAIRLRDGEMKWLGDCRNQAEALGCAKFFKCDMIGGVLIGLGKDWVAAKARFAQLTTQYAIVKEVEPITFIPNKP